MTEIEPLVALSTAHLRPQTLEKITDFVCAYPNEYGAFVYVAAISGYCEGATDLDKVLYWAREMGLVWLKFDRDAPEIEGLPTYAW